MILDELGTRRLASLPLPEDYKTVMSQFVAWYMPSGKPVIKRLEECQRDEFSRILSRALHTCPNVNAAFQAMRDAHLDLGQFIDMYRAVKMAYAQGARPFTFSSYVDARAKESA